MDARDQVFLSDSPRASDFEFDAKVAAVFDDMLVRSVPFYLEQQRMVAEIAKKFWIPGTTVCDLGCSTATTLINIGKEIGDGARLIGYDNSTPMLERARLKAREHGMEDRLELRCGDFNGDLATLSLERASVVTLCWVLQFVRPLRRDRLIRRIYDQMAEGGALIVTEKILASCPQMNCFMVDSYYEFKRRNGYSEVEIARKREALENVLVPYQVEENLEMFRRNGFADANTFFQWYNFAGFVCVKRPE
jgi:tRNA (cmo5U34)-methyltransferase